MSRILTPWGSNGDVLAKRAAPVTKFDRHLHAMLDDMIHTIAGDGAVGLAAPQIGVSQRVVVVDLALGPTYGNARHRYEMINPSFTRTKGQMSGMETCLSLPDMAAEVVRSTFVHIRFQDRNGRERNLKARRFLARVLQHEIDHLDGLLITDVATKIYVINVNDDKRYGRLIHIPNYAGQHPQEFLDDPDETS